MKPKPTYEQLAKALGDLIEEVGWAVDYSNLPDARFAEIKQLATEALEEVL